ncbi:hypothetical protein CWB41_07170 [Methylovirgula ligni]|uniref:Uncharacterized protein n=1 Tax=Methylovirgula ligni TaxID=569860 RepID=A0A3D9ZCB5_9HYPH|nr:hypothetical protein [Methylovirgula ligni]QAY95545.1 hypothetical protein CWB41_07170 [Methylovirgula ligni]REF89116.1 hypothetical protein DES32_0331 [Methylovirgula ligni]
MTFSLMTTPLSSSVSWTTEPFASVTVTVFVDEPDEEPPPPVAGARAASPDVFSKLMLSVPVDVDDAEVVALVDVGAADADDTSS